MMSNGYSRGLSASSESHEEWLLDDAIDDSFPASDPVSHGQPGSILNLRYAALERHRAGVRRKDAGLVPWLVLIAAASVCAVLLARRRR